MAEKDSWYKENETCPLCLKKYTGYPALSRVDNKTPVCSDCGTWEAFHNGLVRQLVQQKVPPGVAFDSMKRVMENELTQ